MKPICVCMVVQNYYQTDPRVRRKADILIEQGYVVDVIALRESRWPRVYELGGVKVYTVPLGKKRGARLRYIFEYLVFWILAFAVVTILSVKHRYDVIEVNNLPDFLVFSAFAPKLLGARILLDMHEIMPEFYMSKFGVDRQHILVRLATWLEQRSIRFADWIIASNDLIAECLIGRGLPSSKLTVVMNSADEKLFRGPKGADPETIGGGNQNHPLILMYHGTLTSIYGLDIAIEALDQVRTQRPDLDIEFHILGSGSAKGELLRQTEKLNLNGIIRFLGNVPLDQVPHYVARCDVGLLSTRQDVFLDMSFSNKLVEYIIMDKPVIASRLKGYQRYFREESLAFFEPCDPDSLGDTIIWMAQNPSVWSDLAANARRDYQAITWEVMGERYLTVINRLQQ